MFKWSETNGWNETKQIKTKKKLKENASFLFSAMIECIISHYISSFLSFFAFAIVDTKGMTIKKVSSESICDETRVNS